MSTQVEFFPGVPVICTCSWQGIDISAVVVVACDDGRIRIWQVPDDLDCTLEDPQDYLIGKMQTRAMCTAGTSWLCIISVHEALLIIKDWWCFSVPFCAGKRLFKMGNYSPPPTKLCDRQLLEMWHWRVRSKLNCDLNLGLGKNYAFDLTWSFYIWGH